MPMFSIVNRVTLIAAVATIIQVFASYTAPAEAAPAAWNDFASATAHSDAALLPVAAVNRRYHRLPKASRSLQDSSSGTMRGAGHGRHYKFPKAARSTEGGGDAMRSTGRSGRGDGGRSDAGRGSSDGGRGYVVNCPSCRLECQTEWRSRCGYSSYCRRKFTSCMRGCWNNYCRR